MREKTLSVCESVEEVDLLPVGARILTRRNLVLDKEEAWGRTYWIEDGTLTPLGPSEGWLPVYILPEEVNR